MPHFDPAQWAQLCTALATLLGVVGTLLSSLKNSRKLDENTAITKETHAAATSGKVDVTVVNVQEPVDSAAVAAPKPPKEISP